MLRRMSDRPDLSYMQTELQSRLGLDAISTQVERRYEVDGLAPGFVATPGTQAEVAAVLALASEHGAAVVSWGGGSRMALGMPPQRYDLALDLSRVNALVEYEPADLTITVEAGMRLSELQRLLGERGQWLPIDPVDTDKSTVGGALATNVSGPARHSRGTLRDLLIGISFVTAEGQLVKAGGRVVKNVAGYDMGKLQIGALGTLGVITQASFKVSPLPEVTRTLTATGPLDSMLELARNVAQARLPLLGAVLSHAASEPQWTLELRFSAGQAAVDRSIRETLAGAPGARPHEEQRPDEAWEGLALLRPAMVIARCSVVPSSVSEVIEAVTSAGGAVVSYPTVATIYGAWDGEMSADTLTELRRRCQSRGGALVLEKAPLALKQAGDVWGPPREDFGLMQRLKQELDPHRVLNPGRYLGGI
jgi:glycolate oxidase FAD binding subunit